MFLYLVLDIFIFKSFLDYIIHILNILLFDFVMKLWIQIWNRKYLDKYSEKYNEEFFYICLKSKIMKVISGFNILFHDWYVIVIAIIISLCSSIYNPINKNHKFYIKIVENNNEDNRGAGGLAWLRYRLDVAGFVGSNPTRPI